MKNNEERIELSLVEYNGMKDVIKEYGNVNAKLNQEIDSLKEKISCYQDAIDYLNQIGFKDRVFQWKKTISYVKELSHLGAVVKKA